MSSYTLTCIVNRMPVSSLIDFGVRVCLLKSEVWEKVKSEDDTIEPITAHRLVGVDSIPIKVQGSATICFTTAGVKFRHKFIIADKITADAILGVDLLEANKCDWIWEKPPVTHKDNYLEKRNWIIQSIISSEDLKLQACNLPHSYSYSRSIRLSSVQCLASWISCHFR